MGRPLLPIVPRFWSKVDTSGECWLWRGARDAELVQQIRARYAAGETHKETLAREFGVTRQNIGYIVTGRTWRG